MVNTRGSEEILLDIKDHIRHVSRRTAPRRVPHPTTLIDRPKMTSQALEGAQKRHVDCFFKALNRVTIMAFGAERLWRSSLVHDENRWVVRQPCRRCGIDLNGFGCLNSGRRSKVGPDEVLEPCHNHAHFKPQEKYERDVRL
jgi:hypothetical protein